EKQTYKDFVHISNPPTADSTPLTIPLALQPQEDDHTHDDVRDDNRHESEIATRPAARTLEQVFTMRADGLRVEIVRDVGCQRAGIRVPLSRVGRGGLVCNGTQRLRDFSATSRGEQSQ